MHSRKSRFLTFVLSLIPGVGHMYLGLMRQGVQLMFIFSLWILIINVANLGILGIFLPIIWFYSVFDALSKASSVEPPADDDTPVFRWLMDGGLQLGNKGRILGYGLIILGALMVVKQIYLPMVEKIFNGQIREFAQTGIVAVLLIAGGIKLLLDSRKQAE